MSGVLGLDRSYSTIDLPDVCDQIDEADLQLGDLIGLMGPGTGGDAGHVMSFESRTATGLVIWEQAGGTIGQRRRTIKGVPAGNACYRYREVLSVDAERLINNMAAILSGVAAGLDSAPQTFPDGHVEPLDITGFYRCDHSGTGVVPEHHHTITAGTTSLPIIEE